MFDYFIDFYIKMQYGYALILTDVFFSVGCVCCLNRFSREIKIWLRRLLEMVFVWLCVIFAASFLYSLVGSTLYNIWSFAVALVVYAVFFSRYRPRIRLEISAFFLAGFLSAMSISETVGYLFRNGVPGEIGGKIDMTVVVQIAVIACITLFLTLNSVEKFVSAPWYCTAFVVTVAAIHIFATQFISRQMGEKRELVTVLNVCFLIIEALVYRIFYMIVKEHNEKIEAQGMYLRSERDRELAAFAKENINKMHELRHDMKNQYAYMGMLIERKEYDRLGEYFKKYSGEILDAVSFTACGNHLFDYLLNIETRKAQEQGVKLDIKIAVAPVLPFDDSDMCSLLTNLLDNAIEACVRNGKEGETATAHVGIRQQQDNLLIRVVSPSGESERKTDGSVNLTSSKKDAQLHGYGVKIIRNIVQKYKGMINYHIEEGNFVADVTLPILDVAKKGEI